MKRFSNFMWRFLNPTYARYHLIVHNAVPMVARHQAEYHQPMPIDMAKEALNWDTLTIRHGDFEQVLGPACCCAPPCRFPCTAPVQPLLPVPQPFFLCPERV